MPRKFRKNSFNKNSVFQITAASLILTSSVLFAYPSIAEEATTVTYESATPSEFGSVDTVESPVGLTMQVQNVEAAATECANIDNPDGLGAAQKAASDDRLTMIGAVTNTDKLFDIANNGGCFNALKNFPNLSVAIPSLSSIADALKKTLINYATRKVCNAVNDALTEVLTPINEALDKVSENGQIDMTGKFNTVMRKELYEIDPELGRVSTSAKNEYSWNLDDAIDSATTPYVDSNSSTDTTSSTQSVSTGGTTSVSSQNTSTDTADEPEESSSSTLVQSTKDVISNFFN